MKKFLKRFFISLLIFVLLAGGYLYWEQQRGKKALAQWKEAARGKGEKLEINQILPKAPRETNVSSVFGNAIKKLTNGLVKVENIALMGYMDPGSARLAWKQRQIIGYGMNLYPWSDLDRQLQSQEEELKQIRQVLIDPPARTGWDYTRLFEAIPQVPYWIVGQTLSASALANLHNNKLEAALEDLQAMGALTRLYEDEPTKVLVLGRSFINSMGMAIVWEALQAPGWTDPQLSALQNAWKQKDILDAWIRSCELERSLVSPRFIVFRESSYESFVAKHADLQQKGYSPTKPAEKPWEIHLKNFVVTPIWKFGWSHRMEVTNLKFTQFEIDKARDLSKKKSWMHVRDRKDEALNRELKNSFGTQVYAYLHALNNFVSPSTMPKATLDFCRGETSRQMFLTAIALKRFYLANNKYPEKLEELVPQFLPEMPLDYMDGNPLKYRLQKNSAPLLYSVGEDGKDDGGRSDWKSATVKNPTMWSGLDAVWPAVYQPAARK